MVGLTTTKAVDSVLCRVKEFKTRGWFMEFYNPYAKNMSAEKMGWLIF